MKKNAVGLVHFPFGLKACFNSFVCTYIIGFYICTYINDLYIYTYIIFKLKVGKHPCSHSKQILMIDAKV